MKINTINNEEHRHLLLSLIQCEKQEHQAIATLTSNTLLKLNISIEELPRKCQQILHTLSTTQCSVDIDHLDTIAISLHQSRELSQKLEDEYELLKLRQKNEELQRKIDNNKKFIEGLRRELERSRNSLAEKVPGPDDIKDYIRQAKQKLASYEESCEKAKAKYTRLSIPEAIMPASLSALVTSLGTLREEAVTLRRQADDVTLTRDAIEKLNRLRR